MPVKIHQKIKVQAEWDRDNEWNYCLYQLHDDECSENITKKVAYTATAA